MTGLKASLLMIVGFAMTGAFHHAPGGMQTAMWGKGQTTTKTKTIHGRTTSRLEGRGPRMMTMMEPSKICVLRSPWTTDEAAEAAASKLRLRGFPVDIVDDDGGADGQGGVCYRWQPATGMFCLLDQANGGGGDLLPKWVSPQGSEETFLEERGWGFISRPDASDGEQMSAFDIDAANLEGKYKPAWGQGSGNAGEVSALGFNITVMDAWEVSGATSSLCEVSIAVLIRGETETPGRKLTACEQAVAYTAGMRGTFCCAVSGLPLFCTDSLTADTATSGWLSFVAPVDPTHVITRTDTGHGQVRTEALCARSRCHLGHFFPPNSWCINAASLTFHPSSSPLPPPSRPLGPLPSSAPSPLTDSLFMPPLERTIIAAGCFWQVQKALRTFPGVVRTRCGYAGGHAAAPSYSAVSAGGTGHCECVEVLFDTQLVGTVDVVRAALACHDPTMVRAVGKAQRGTGQYRSAVFVSQRQRAAAEEAVRECEDALKRQVATEVADSCEFWEAEEEHQDKEGGVGEVCASRDEWLSRFGVRAQAVWGGVNVAVER